MAGYGIVSPPPLNQNGFGNYAGSPVLPQFQQQQPPYAPPQQQQQIRPGTLPPGTCIKIGDYEVTIDRFLSEGGFAHVYLVRSSQPIPSPGGSSESYHVLKRVAAADKTILREIRWEVDVMKLLRGHKYIVNLIEASASIIPGSTGYEVFILMEYCSGGGIIDMMNTRLQNRLTEAEILKIFSDVVEGVCWMHTRDPPLMHRDLKVENILMSSPGFYKLCDFGSTSVPKQRPAQSIPEIQELEMELNKHTTLQYRAPEMCDVWSRKGVGLPADIWALGVLLYKLCFYTTPFEEHGPLAILNVQYSMPSFPNYSVDIRNLIASTLVEAAGQRPTAWQVHKEVCRLRGVAPKSDYQISPSQKLLSAGGSPSLGSGKISPALPNLPISRPASGLGSIVNVQAPSSSQPQQQPVVSQEEMNGLSPMRRGRPGKNVAGPVTSASTLNLRSEWEVPSAATGTSTGAEQAGFGDSFAPPIPTISQPSPTEEAGGQQVPEPTKQSKTALATAALFEELSSPGSTVKPIPTLASLAAAKNNGTGYQQQQQMPSLPPKPSGLAYGGVGPAQQGGGGGGGFRRVSPGKPLGPRTLAGANNGNGQPHLPMKIENETTVIEPLSIPQQDTRMPTKSNSASAALEIPPINTGSAVVNQRKPALVSRGSQTSPVLLSDWKKRDLLSQKGTMPSQPEEPSKEPNKGEMDRFPSLDDWEGSSTAPTPAHGMLSPTMSSAQSNITGTSASSNSTSTSNRARQPSFDLLGDDPDGMGTVPTLAEQQPSPIPSPSLGTTTPLATTDTGNQAFSPPTLTRSPSNISSTSSSAVSPTASSGTSFSSFQRAPSISSSFSSLSTKPEPPKDKYKPVKKDSPTVQRQVSASSVPSTPSVDSQSVPAEADSSDDEDAGPEDPAGQHYGNGRTTPTRSEPRPITKTAEPPRQDSLASSSMSSSNNSRQGSGNFDIKPALATNEKFAPRPNNNGVAPPMLAPKPNRAGVSNLLSRYEGISGSSASSSAVSSRSTGDRQVPTKPPKPSYGSLSSNSSSGAVSAEDDFSSRFPSLDEPTSVEKSKVPPLTPVQSQTSSIGSGKKELFKPSRENSSNSLSSLAEGGRPRPKSMHYPSPSPAPAPSKAVKPEMGKQEEAEEEEERFQGVASMRDRWQKMGQQSQSQSQSQSGATVGRRSSTLGHGTSSTRWK